MNLSRRTFLKSLGMVGAGLAAQGPLSARAQSPDDPPADDPTLITHWDGSEMGRILLNVMTVYREPSWRSAQIGKYYWSDIIEVEEAVVGEGLWPSNSTWLKIDGGYIYSSWVQPVRSYPPAEPHRIDAGGAWAMVTAPSTRIRSEPSESSPARETMYFSTVHRVTDEQDGFYHVEEIYGADYWMSAADMRIIPPAECEPISPDVDPEDKWIEVSIRDQHLWAYEGDREVFSSHVSTGTPETPTELGEHAIHVKRHSQRMVGGEGENHYNLPGIGWVCYFTNTFAATHGTYWHNDYGRRHSNGCVNLPPAAAKWIFRWTTPQAVYSSFSTNADPDNGRPGTRVVVRW